MYVLFRARQLLGSVPALIALVLIALGIQSQTLKVEPVYDESAVELALVEPEPEVVPEPVVEQEPPPPVIEEEEAEPAPRRHRPSRCQNPNPSPSQNLCPSLRPWSPSPRRHRHRWPPNQPRLRWPKRHRHPPHRRHRRSMARPWKAVISKACATNWTPTSGTPLGARPPSNARAAKWWCGCW